VEWAGLGIGLAVGLGDFAIMRAFGADMRLCGRDATTDVLLAFAGSYAVIGWAVGRIARGRARARRDRETIASQLRALSDAQRELVQQEKLAAIGRLAAGVAHEVRNPLGVIRASAAMLRESHAPGDDAHRACDFICEEIDRLNGLIEALLAFARPTEPKLARVDATGVAERARRLAAPDAERREVALELRASAGALEIHADPDLLAQAVYDLICNALEAVEAGGRVRIAIAPSGSDLSIEVADDGPGVDPGLGAQVFEPFFTTKARGTGLGLAMVERIAHAHGGRAELQPGGGLGPGGRGACLRLRLPRDRHAAAAESSP
jgi:signal transduction histidine kinase